jgi:phosphatidylglycerol---prolipoprotein diacylglyceryl transferase
LALLREFISHFPQVKNHQFSPLYPVLKQALVLMIPFLHIGPLMVPTFGLMVAAAMVASYFVLCADIKRRGIDGDPATVAETFVAVPCLAGLAGAKLYHALESPRAFFANSIGQFFSRFGLAWFGV